MKNTLLFFVVLSIFAVSCSESMKTVSIDGTSLKVTMYERDRIDTDQYSSELMLGGKKKVRVLFEKIEETKFPTDLDFLLKSLGENFKVTEKHNLKNGAFGISYTLNIDGKETKNYLFYLKKGNECYKIYNNEYYNTEMEHFDYVKSVIESMQ